MVAMLMQFKNKQRKIASITVSLFMGSWLLLLCQTCFAADNAIKSHSEPSTETSSSCHTPENIALEQTSETVRRQNLLDKELYKLRDSSVHRVS